MGSYQNTGVCLILISSILLGAHLHAADTVFFREDFETLDAWEPLFFPGIDRHTTYSTQNQDGASVLVAKSSDSASALVHKRTFNVMIPLQHGPEKVGQWVAETVNVLEDYKRFFGGNPPPEAALGIMNDSDNMGERSTSYIRFIEVLK